MKRCKLCVIPDTRPDTAFVDGVCSACLSYANRPAIDWDARHKELLALLDRHDGKCIVPSSGGKDSTYQVITLLELGADVTIVTAATCMPTEMGLKNRDSLGQYALTHVFYQDTKLRAKLNRFGLEMVGDISWPEHVAIFTTPFRAACELKIPLLFYGENPQHQYGGPLGSEQAKQMTRRWVAEFGGFLGLRPSDIAAMGFDMSGYALPEQVALDAVGVEAHFLGQYIQWDSHRNAAVAMAHGFQCQRPTPANWWRWENQDNAQTGLHDYMMFLKYGYGRGAAQISVDIRAGLVSRDDALAWVEIHDGMFPDTYMDVSIETVLDHIGVTRAHLDSIMDRFTNKAIVRELA